jgi:hypothetical protein
MENGEKEMGWMVSEGAQVRWQRAAVLSLSSHVVRVDGLEEARQEGAGDRGGGRPAAQVEEAVI